MTGTLKLTDIGVLMLLTLCGLVMVINGSHAIERHGLSAVSETRAKMDNCRLFPGVEFSDGKVRITALFSGEKRGCFQVLSGPREDPDSREITTVPEFSIRDIQSLIMGWVERRGYKILETWGDVPAWLEALK